MARKKRMQSNDRFARREKKKLPSLSPCRFFFLFFPLFLRLPWSRARRERRRERALAGRRALSAQKSREREKRASKLVEVFFFGSERGRGATDEGHIKTYEPINEKRSNSLSLSVVRLLERANSPRQASGQESSVISSARTRMTPPERRHGGEKEEEAEQPPSIADGAPRPRPGPALPPLPLPRRKRFVLFGDSITQQSFAQGGWGALLADAYARKVKRRGEREDRSL